MGWFIFRGVEAAVFVDHVAGRVDGHRRARRSYALTIFLPTLLKTERHMTSVGTGSYLFVLIVGAFFGFVSGAFLADAIGRRNRSSFRCWDRW